MKPEALAKLAPTVLVLVMFALAFWLVFGLGRESTTIAFDIEPEQVFDLIVFDAETAIERHAYNRLHDQDQLDADRGEGRYAIHVENPGGRQLTYELEEAAMASAMGPVALEAKVSGSPFAGGGARAWLPLDVALGTFQSRGGGKPVAGRAVDVSAADRPVPVSAACDVELVRARPEGGAAALVRTMNDHRRLEIHIRDASSGEWSRSAALDGLTPPVDPLWHGAGLLFLEVGETGGAVSRWDAGDDDTPRRIALVPGARHLLVADASGGLWLGAEDEREFFHHTPDGRTTAFEAHSSMALLRHYLPAPDAFLILVPALDRAAGADLVLRHRLGETSKTLRTFSARVFAASASEDLSTLLTVERCRRKSR